MYFYLEGNIGNTNSLPSQGPLASLGRDCIDRAGGQRKAYWRYNRNKCDNSKEIQYINFEGQAYMIHRGDVFAHLALYHLGRHAPAYSLILDNRRAGAIHQSQHSTNITNESITQLESPDILFRRARQAFVGKID